MTPSSPGDEPAHKGAEKEDSDEGPTSPRNRRNRLRRCFRVTMRAGAVITVLVRLYIAIREGWSER
jgi:hypothetical protein